MVSGRKEQVIIMLSENKLFWWQGRKRNRSFPSPFAIDYLEKKEEFYA